VEDSTILGNLDEVNAEGRVYGWALDSDAHSKQPQVQAFVDGGSASGKLIRTVTANAPRADVNKNHQVTGDHGFSFSIPPLYKDDKTHTLFVYAVVEKGLVLLKQSPKTFSYKNVIGAIDSISSVGKAEGWALANTLGEKQVRVLAYVDGDSKTGKLIRTVTANATRADVNEKTRVPGDHGFRFSIQDEYKDSRPHSLRVYAEGPSGLVEVAGSPQTFKFDKYQFQLKIADKSNSNPVQGASVKLTDGSGKVTEGSTGDDGLARFTLLANNYKIEATKSGFKDHVSTVTVDRTFEHVVELEPFYPKRMGTVRLNQKTLVDDSGPFNALGATLFSAARYYKFDRARLERHLETLSKNGFDYIRALGVVAWEGREIDWRWEDYRQVIEGVTDLAYDKYGIRVQWTIFGDAQMIIPNRSDRQRLVELFLDISKGREQKIIMFEVANEYWQNGFEEDEGINQLREFTRFLNDRTPILTATSAAGEECGELNEGGIADVGIKHFDRDIGDTDGYWKPVRQPWDYQCDGLPVGSNNEPIGPGSSVACDSDPMRIAMAAVTTYNSGLPFYVYHTRVGVGQATRCGLDGDQEFSQMPGIEAFNAMKRYMPPGSSGWTRNGHASSGNPLMLYGDGTKFRTTSDGAQNGCMRNYASTKENEFVSAAIGCRGVVKFEARREVNFEVIHPLTGEVLRKLALAAGESFEIDGLEAYILKGTMSGTVEQTECNGDPLTILECHRSRYGEVMSHDELNALLRGAAHDFNRNGVPGGPFGVLRKVSGNNCNGYSCDILCSGQGEDQKQWDVLISEDIPTWGEDIGPGIRIDFCEVQ
jgi:hypothetical protein